MRSTSDFSGVENGVGSSPIRTFQPITFDILYVKKVGSPALNFFYCYKVLYTLGLLARDVCPYRAYVAHLLRNAQTLLLRSDPPRLTSKC